MKTTLAKARGIDAVCFILVWTLFVGVPLGAMAAETVKFGDLEPMSGPFEAYGRGRISFNSQPRR